MSNSGLYRIIKAYWARYRKSQDAIRHFEKVLENLEKHGNLGSKWHNALDALNHHRKVCEFHYNKAKSLQPLLEIKRLF